MGTTGQCYGYNTEGAFVEILPPCKLREVRGTREAEKAIADILKQKGKKLVELLDNIAAIDDVLVLPTTKRLCNTKGSYLVQDVTPVAKAKRVQDVTPVPKRRKL